MNTTAPNLNSTVATLTTVSAPLLLPEPEELSQFITAINSFHPALKYTWKISDSSLAFLDIKLSIEGNGLCTSVHYKPTDSHSYLPTPALYLQPGKFSILLLLDF